MLNPLGAGKRHLPERRQRVGDSDQVGLVAIRYDAHELDLVFPEDGVQLPGLMDYEATDMEVAITGVSLGDHLMSRYRHQFNQHGILNSRSLRAPTLPGRKPGLPGGARSNKIHNSSNIPLDLFGIHWQGFV